MTLERRRHALRLATLWTAALALAVIAFRPLTPVDETRYTTVAWEMWQSGDWISLHLNGHLYGHKPPLLFWLVNAGWHLFGVNEWWPRVLTAGFALATLALTLRLARRLAPGRDDIASLAVFIAGASLYWMVFTGAVMFDTLLSFFVLLGIGAVEWAARGGGVRAWAVTGLATGLGVLTKGPVALLHVLPLALLGPLWWADTEATGAARPRPARWYGGIGVAIGVAAAVALAWAIPTAVAGGEAFRREIFVSQSVDRIATTVHHLQPWWFYVATLPALLAPWLFLPAVWRGLPALAQRSRAVHLRFLLAWLVPVVLAFSAFRGKQVQYLLPLVPGAALLLAAALATRSGALRRWELAVPAALLALPALVLPWLAQRPSAAHLLPPGSMLAVLGSAAAFAVAAIAVVTAPRDDVVRAAARIGTATVVALVGLYAGAGRVAFEAYDVHPIARQLAALQQAGHPIAHADKYHGQFQFVGRLREPLVELPHREALLEWARSHPDGRVVVYSAAPLVDKDGARAEFEQRFRSRYVSVWKASALEGLPQAGRRGEAGDASSDDDDER
jgi:4-amino-4-deoxy-L-arabinose transferase-like glycosyltransferase